MNAMNVMMGGAQPQTQVAMANKMPELKSMNDNQFLDFETSKVQILTLDQLKRTEKENDVYGNSLKRMYHFDIIDKVQEMCAAHGYKAEI